MFHKFRWGAVFLAPVLTVALSATPAQTADVAYERVLNGTFDSVKTPWWSSANTPSAIDLGRLCADVPAGTVNVWDSMIGQNDIPLEAGQPYTLRFTASATRDVSIHAVLQLPAPPPVLRWPVTGSLLEQQALLVSRGFPAARCIRDRAAATASEAGS